MAPKTRGSFHATIGMVVMFDVTAEAVKVIESQGETMILMGAEHVPKEIMMATARKKRIGRALHKEGVHTTV